MQRSPHWSKLREQWLVVHRHCAVCDTTDHLEVHHIEPFHVNPDRELDTSNLITLCEKPGHSCHFVFGHFHDWYKYNPEVRSMAARYNLEQRSAP
jgi:hypothetical protein